MKKIKKLSENLINKISATRNNNKLEVVLKELLENSCDAKSSKIIIHINNNGKKKYIKIIDNGTGINKINIKNVGSEYNTNKIKNEKDLTDIKLYGFKGESLFLIKQTYDVEIISKPRNQKFAYKLYLRKKSKKVKIDKITNNIGTTVIIKNIKYIDNILNLYNTLKCIALPNPHIHFILYKNSIEKLNFPACKNTEESKLRIKNILKKKYIKNSVDINYSYKNLDFSGFITFEKKITNNMFKYFFLNNRFVKCKLLEDIITDNLKILNLNFSIGFYITLKTKLNLLKIKLTPEKDEFYLNNNKMHKIFTQLIKLYIHQHKKFINVPKLNFVKNKINLNIEDKEYEIIDQKLICNYKNYLTKNKILTVINNEVIIFEYNKKIYKIDLKNIRFKYIIRQCVNQYIKNNGLKYIYLKNLKYYNIKKKYYIIMYDQFFKIYGFKIKLIDNKTILIQAIPNVLKHLAIDWNKLINKMIEYFSKSMIMHFSKNKFDINIINIFIDHINSKSNCYKHELKKLYKEIIYVIKNDKKWFKKNSKKIYGEKKCMQ